MKRDAFIIMPFSPTANCKDWTEVYEHLFSPTLLGLGWSCERAEPVTGNLIVSIIDRLNTATVVLADITDRNANVYYELGVRHSLSMRTVMLSQSEDHVPSDLKGYWHIIYGLSPGRVSKFKGDLGRVLNRILENPGRSDNPVGDYLQGKNQSIYVAENRHNVKRLNALITEINGNVLELQSYLTQDYEFPENRAKPILTLTGLSLLLDTYYVDPGADALKIAYEFRQCLVILSRSWSSGDSTAKGALHLARELVNSLEDIRNQIERGVFFEPAVPSRYEVVCIEKSRKHIKLRVLF